MITKQCLSICLLIFAAAIWGITFTVVKDALTVVGPFEFLAVRMTIAAVIISLWSSCRRPTLISLSPGLIAGLFLFGGYALQTIGLQYTSASRAAFLTGLCVVIVPLLSGFIAHRWPQPVTWLAVVLAVIGTCLLTLPDTMGPGTGDILVLGCAVCFSLQILFVGRYAKRVDTLRFVGSQLWLTALLSVSGAVWFEQWHPARVISYSADIWWAILITAVLATAFAFWIQSWAQRITSPTLTSLVFASEPVFATVYAWGVGRETVTLPLLAGGLTIVIAMVLGGTSETRPELHCPSTSRICRENR